MKCSNKVDGGAPASMGLGNFDFRIDSLLKKMILSYERVRGLS
jgi:hypothetical protein